MGKNNFLISDDWSDMIKALPKDKAGELFQGLYELRSNPDYEIEDPVLSAIFQMMKNYMCANEDKYQKRCEKNAENGAKSHENKPKKANVSERKRSVANATESNPKSAEVSYSLSVNNIVNYLNNKTSKNFSPNNVYTRKLIIARLKEGFTEEDFCWLIDTKVDEWLNNNDMSKYLRPNTLFAPSHFDEYLNQRPRGNPSSKIGNTQNSPPIPDKYADYESVTFDG